MNTALDNLQPYPFEKLRALLGGARPPATLKPIALSIGEPKHRSPSFVAETLAENLDQLAVYPTTLGLPALREAIARWCERRFSVPAGWLDAARHVLPVNGTREALFAFTQTVVRRSEPGEAPGLVVSPNPFYQIYEGAALLAGAVPHYLPCREENGFNPDFDAVDEATWQRCRVHFMRNALAHASKGQRSMVAALLRTAFAQDSEMEARQQWRMVADQLRERFPRIAHLMDNTLVR